MRPSTRFALAALVTLAALVPSACTQAPQPRPRRPPPPVWPATHLGVAHWSGPQAGARIGAALDAAAADSARVVLFQLRRAETASDGSDPLAAAVEQAHARGLRLHVELPAPPTDGGHLRGAVRHLAEAYPIDGLHLTGGSATWVEALFVEALLVKPYLLLSTTADSLAAVSPATAARGLAPVAELRLPEGTGATLWRAAEALRLDLAPWVTAAEAYPDTVAVRLDSLRVRRAAGGHFTALLPDLPDTLGVLSGSRSLVLPTRFWKPPYRFTVDDTGGLARTAPWVELRAAPPDTSGRSAFEFLGRTDPAAAAAVQGAPVRVYPTGVFFDSVALAPGRNRVRLEARWPDGRRALYEDDYVRVDPPPRPALPAWLDGDSAAPGTDLALTPDDIVRLSIRGAPGHRAVARLEPGGLELPMSRVDGEAAAVYRADLHVARLRPGRRYTVEVRLTADDGSRARHELDAGIEVRRAHDFPLLVTSGDESYLNHSLGRVRLGGPYIAEYPAGVVLQASGRFGPRWRVRLGPERTGYIHERYVDELPAGHVRPGYHLRSIIAVVTDSTDEVRIPWPEPVPWQVRSDPQGRRLVVTLHGVQTASTWLSHVDSLQVVERVTWQQPDAETYELSVHLATDRIWGYDLVRRGASLVLSLRHPPVFGQDPAKPLLGLRVAIEAGHGGDNTGAIGLSGRLERDINLATARVLGQLCEQAGAQVYQLRDGRQGVPYMARRDSVRALGADLFLSVHANAAGGGFLRVSGTSTYYHDPFWAPLAADIYARLLELGLGEFGTVGSFNYRPTRMSSVPAVLVEQAFMTHAEDEALLASPEGRQAIAEQVLAGLLDWLAGMPGAGPQPGAGAPSP